MVRDMSAPITSTQTPDNSILDINGRQTYLGNTFTLPMPGFQINNTSENTAFIISNPAGSGKSLFIYDLNIFTNNSETTNILLTKVYINPVIDTAGSSTAALNTRFGSNTVSVSLCYLGASVISNGTLLTIFPTPTTGFRSNVIFVIDQGYTLLFTAQQTSESVNPTVFIETTWYEI